MRRRLSRLRRLGASLLGGLLLHSAWVTATAVCEPAVVPAAAPAAMHHASTGHHHHHAPADQPTPAPHDATRSAQCPMAMACTLSALRTDVPTVATRTVAIAATSPRYVAYTPRTTRVAPEPPPPRA